MLVADLARQMSDHLERNGAQKISLANLDAAVAQDRVGCRAMEIDVGQHKVIEVVVALHLALVRGTKRERDLAVAPGIDLLRIHGLDERNRLCDARLELLERRLVVLEARRLDAGKARHSVLRE